jgi:thioredoxin reductase
VQAITRSGWTGEPDKIDAVGKFNNVEMLPPSNIVRIEGGEVVESVIIETADDGQQQSLDIDLIFVQSPDRFSSEHGMHG